MLIQYVATGAKRNVAEKIGKQLIANGIARSVVETRDLTPATISPRTGKPKRRYMRRDLQAED